MLIADGGGGYGGTNWFAHDVRTMWSLLANQETDAHWRLVQGWRQSYELTSTHLWRVKSYRDNLAQAWPPESSAASAAYLARLDELIGNLQETYDAAVANYTTFASATGALSTTRHELKKIYEQYVANEAAIQQYEADKAAATARATPSPTPTPSPQASPVPSTPPVSGAQQEQLNNRARSLMSGLSSTLIDARVQIKQPTPYKPVGTGRQDGQGDVYSSGGSTASAPFPIPPITVFPDAPTQSVSTPRQGPPSTPVTVSGPTTGSPVGGPALGGTLPGAVTSSAVSGTPSASVGVTGPITGSPVHGGVITPPIAPSAVTPGSIRPGVGTPSGGSVTPGVVGGTGAVKPGPGPGGVAGGGVRPMPPGGVIGGAPVAGLRQPATPVQPARRINPVGGVIGGTRPGGFVPQPGMTGQPYAGSQGQGSGRPPRIVSTGTVNVGPNSTTGQQYGAGQGRGVAQGHSFGQRPAASGSGTHARTGIGSQFGTPISRARAQEQEQSPQPSRWDPDNPWKTEEGVAPVVLPPADLGRIDPGPAIGSSR